MVQALDVSSLCGSALWAAMVPFLLSDQRVVTVGHAGLRDAIRGIDFDAPTTFRPSS